MQEPNTDAVPTITFRGSIVTIIDSRNPHGGHRDLDLMLYESTESYPAVEPPAEPKHERKPDNRPPALPLKKRRQILKQKLRR